MEKRLSRDIYAYIAIVAVILLFFSRLFFPAPKLITTPDFGQSDALTDYSAMYFSGTALARHQIPLWNSMIGGGYPMYATGMGTFFLPNIILFSTLPPIYAYNLSLVFCICLLGCGMYAWLRLLGYRHLPSFFGAITTALSGYVIPQITHNTIIYGISLFPLIAYFTHRLALHKKLSSVGILAFLISQQLLIGFPQTVFITSLFMAAYWCWLLRLRFNILDIFRFVSAFILAVGLSAVQLLPSMEFLSQVVNAGVFSPEAATQFSYPYKQLLTLIHPYILGNPANGTYPHFILFGGSVFWENSGYIGILPLTLILLYTAKNIFFKKLPVHIKPDNRIVIFLCILLFTSFLLMTGSHSPLYFIFSLWPFSIFRVPSRFLWIFEIALILLSVHAFDTLLSIWRETRTMILVTVFLLLLHILNIFLIWTPYHQLQPADEWLKPPTLLQYLTPHAETITLGGEKLYNATYTKNGWILKDPKIDPSYFLRNTFTPDKSMLWNVYQLGDYAGRTTRRSRAIIDLISQSIKIDESHATVSAFGVKMFNMLSVKNVISTLNLNQKEFKVHAELTNPTSYIGYFDNPGAVPRAYLANNAISVTTVEGAVDVLMSDTFVPGRTVLVEDMATPSANLNGGEVKIRVQDNGYYNMTVRNDGGPSILVLAETFYPGWVVTVDGGQVPVFPVNIKHVGVLVPGGTHEVTYKFESPSFVRGALISGAFLALTAVLIAFGLFSESRSTAPKEHLPSSGRRHNRDMSSPHTK